MIATIPYRIFSRSIICLLLPLTGCATYDSDAPKLLFDEIIIYNRSLRDIANVEMHVEKFNQVFACSRVVTKTICSNTFSPRTYEGNAITISWADAESTHSKADLMVDVPDSYATYINYTAIIEIDKDGVYSAYFRENASWM